VPPVAFGETLIGEDPPAAFVHEVVVPPAQQNQIPRSQPRPPIRSAVHHGSRANIRHYRSGDRRD
jgi:hypothetical protein